MEGVSGLMASLPGLIQAVEEPAAAAEPAGPTQWMGAPAKSYANISASVELAGLDMLNASGADARTLFAAAKPSGRAADGVESETDEQLMLFVPLQAVSKVHSIQITSLAAADADDDEAPSRPRTVKLFCNTHHILGFEEADEREPTQTVVLAPGDWNAAGTATIATKFVRFQSVNAITLFFVDVERDGAEKVRVDRVRLVGEVMGERVDMGKLKQADE